GCLSFVVSQRFPWNKIPLGESCIIIAVAGEEDEYLVERFVLLLDVLSQLLENFILSCIFNHLDFETVCLLKLIGYSAAIEYRVHQVRPVVVVVGGENECIICPV